MTTFSLGGAGSMGRIFEVRKHAMFARWNRMAKQFARGGKDIAIAVKAGGPDPTSNPALRRAMQNARAVNMPKDNVMGAIKRASGKEAANYQEVIYEGYAPHGIAILVEVATDNKNRAAADLRLIFSKNHGNLASSGSVSYLFKRRGQITIPRASIEEDKLLERALEAGAEDVSADDEHHVVTTAHDRLYAVADALRQSGVIADSQRLTFIPDSIIQLTDESVAQQVLRLCDALEDNDDVQHVYANFDVPEDILARISG
jgi:YebC/PmpR family DNA-binding regulatory protein